jgi:hypothetical protein
MVHLEFFSFFLLPFSTCFLNALYKKKETEGGKKRWWGRHHNEELANM